MSRPKALVLTKSDPTRAPRPNRMINRLKKSYDVTVVGAGKGRDDVTFVEFRKPPRVPRSKRLLDLWHSKTGQFEKIVWEPQYYELVEKFKNEKFDLVVTHDLSMLPLVDKLGEGTKTLFDAREYYPRMFDDRFLWRVFYQDLYTYLCETYLSRMTQVITVSEGIKEEYKKVYNVDCFVVTSMPDFVELDPSPTSDKIRLIYHGNACPSRSLDKLIEMMDMMDDRFELTLMLVPKQKGYFKKLHDLAAARPNTTIIPPVSMNEITSFINSFDIGIYNYESVNFNIQHSLPNKFFEFIQARLAVAIGPSVEPKRFVEKYELGIVANDFSPRAMAKSLNSLSTTDISRFKTNSASAAKHLNSDTVNQNITSVLEHMHLPV